MVASACCTQFYLHLGILLYWYDSYNRAQPMLTKHKWLLLGASTMNACTMYVRHPFTFKSTTNVFFSLLDGSRSRRFIYSFAFCNINKYLIWLHIFKDRFAFKFIAQDCTVLIVYAFGATYLRIVFSCIGDVRDRLDFIVYSMTYNDKMHIDIFPGMNDIHSKSLIVISYICDLIDHKMLIK